jgi:hypothetical protein
MGQEYWMQYKTDRKKVEAYLKSLGFPKDSHDKKTLIIASEKGKVDCWLSWHGTQLDIASQIFDDQSAWCAAICRRLHELFPCDRFGADSTGWWDGVTPPHRPFYYTLRIFNKIAFPEEAKDTEKRQRLFIKEAKRLLPDPPRYHGKKF